jgi:hypothetical protein
VTYLARLKAKIRENSAPEQLTKPTKPNSTSSVGSVGALRTRFLCGEPHGTEIEERKAMAMGGVPEAYLDGWARLQCQRQPLSRTMSGGRRSLMRACFWINGEAWPLNLDGPPQTCSTRQARATRAVWFGG